LGRQGIALEDMLSVTIFDRAGRGLILTEAGGRLLDHARAMHEAADRISLTASGENQSIEGRACITASEVMMAHTMPNFAQSLQDTASKFEIDLIADDDLRDLQRREADIAIRHIRPTQPDLIAHLVTEPTARLYAATNYIERRGRPKRLAGLTTHDSSGSATPPAWSASSPTKTPSQFPRRLHQ